jgi:DNA polymerase-1
LGDPDHARLASLFRELEFRQLQKAFQVETAETTKHYQTVQDPEALAALRSHLETAQLLSVDTETTSQDPMRAAIVGISLATRPHEAFYVPCGHTAGPEHGPQLGWEQIRETLRPVLENQDKPKVGQNIKYDWIVLQRHGITLGGVIFDTMLASYLLDPSKRAHNLDQIALDYLGHKTISYQEVAGKGSRAVSFAEVPLDKAAPYACEDADITLMAKLTLEQELQRWGLDRLMQEVEVPLIPVLMRMEMQGICVDRGRLRSLSRDFSDQLASLEADIYKLAGERFNINSSRQLGSILFEKLGLPVQKKTKKKTAYSTDVRVLTHLAAEHDLPALILQHRSLAKLKSTYADALIELIHPATGRIHTSFNQTVTATGRLSSSSPNLQNIPIRTEEGRKIRGAFVPRQGWVLVSADYSQIELRLLAHCSEDDILIQAFDRDEDVHTRTAAEVFGLNPSEVTPELRRQAKAINFGIIYGMSPYGLAQQLGIGQAMAKAYIDHYFERYRGVQRFLQETVAAARRNRHTSTLLGRIRRLPDIDSSNHNMRQFAERTAINTPIQGSAADLIKLAMIRTDAALQRSGMRSVMLLSVHDELLFEAPLQERADLQEMIEEVMTGIWRLKVPLRVNFASGSNWAEAH